MGSVLRGMENWFTDLLLNPNFAQALLERVLEFDLGYWDHVLSEIGLYVQIGDDLGSEEDVKKEVKRRIQDLAPGGGYVFSPVHNIQPEVPPQNLVTAFNAAKKYGG